MVVWTEYRTFARFTTMISIKCLAHKFMNCIITLASTLLWLNCVEQSATRAKEVNRTTASGLGLLPHRCHVMWIPIDCPDPDPGISIVRNSSGTHIVEYCMALSLCILYDMTVLRWSFTVIIVPTTITSLSYPGISCYGELSLQHLIRICRQKDRTLLYDSSGVRILQGLQTRLIFFVYHGLACSLHYRALSIGVVLVAGPSMMIPSFTSLPL